MRISTKQKCLNVLRKVFSQCVGETIEAMAGYIPLPAIMAKLLSDNGNQEFGDFKLVIHRMLSMYLYEKRILVWLFVYFLQVKAVITYSIYFFVEHCRSSLVNFESHDLLIAKEQRFEKVALYGPCILVTLLVTRTKYETSSLMCLEFCYLITLLPHNVLNQIYLSMI